MNLTDAVLTASIAAVVSLVGALVSYSATRRALAAEQAKLERQLQRGLTEKLYNLRLSCYPEAMHITEQLRKSRLRDQPNGLTLEYTGAVLQALDDWHSKSAAFLLSASALESLYEVRRALRDMPAEGGKYSEAQIQRMWEAKNRLRQSLRSDIILLYGEEHRGVES